MGLEPEVDNPPSSPSPPSELVNGTGDPQYGSSLLAALQPQPVQCSVLNLTISAPVPQWTIPMAIPITVPRWIQQKLQNGREAVPKEIVRGVNLEVKAGEVLAIIGGSGSGKTTLLNAIADRAGNLDLPTGSITYSPLTTSAPLSSSTPSSPDRKKHEQGIKAKKVIGYVRQDDYLLPFLTVRETLTFAAALRLPRSVPRETRDQIVEKTITELGLADAANVIVGGAGRKGISGGEKRRLSIGCVLVTLPSVLVLDEPTSGLDSFTAYHLLGTLSRLAKRGRCVVLSIHQPRSDAFPLFDKITLLSKGSVVYSGLRHDLLAHFSSLGLSPPKRTNPLDFVIDVSSVDNRDDEAERESRDRVGKLIVAWKEYESRNGKSAIWDASPSSSSEGSTPLSSDLDVDAEKGIRRVTSRPSGERQFDGKDSKRANMWQQTVLLTRRNLINASRNYGMNVGLFLQAVIIGVGIGLCFLRLPETPSGIQSLKTVVYFFAPGFFYLSIVIAVFNLCQELIIFDREQDDNLYGTVPWVVALILGNLPANVIFPTLFAVILYFMAGLRTESLAKNVLSWIACAIMLQQSSWSYALLAASINRSFASASLLANGFSILFVLSSGYIITNLGVWISWTRWLSPYFYSFNWQIRLQFDNRQFECAGVSGPALNQCVGRNVLTGMRLNLNTPLYVFPLGLLGFILVTYVWAAVQLAYFHPGGIKYAAQVSPNRETPMSEAEELQEKPGKKRSDTDPSQLNSRKESVDVVVEDLKLVVSKRRLTHRGETMEKVILEKVNARFPAGQVSVIMGPSGAGKSSLLQMLAGRLNSGAMSDFSSSGTIKLNGKEYDSSLASLVAFVEQEDTHHLPALTVRETLRYAARLRLQNATAVQCDARAEEVLRMLGLKDCADNLVGGELVKGISGGEKRRLSLAVQLLSDPPVLLADEPLSGLDAFVARNVMQTLKDLASSGRTLIVSVHQPRSDIWQMFDNVLLLVKGGKTGYSGPTSRILETLQDVGEACPANFNPADFILDVVSVDHRSVEAEERSSERVEKILKHYTATESASSEWRQEHKTMSNRSARLQNTPFFRAFPVVLSRSFKNLRRQQDIFVARIANPPFMALLFWLFFGRLGFGPSSAQDRVGLLQETTALPFVGMLSCVAIFPFERDLYFHEHKSSARHSVLTFLLAYTVQETIVSIISSFLFSVIFIWGMNMQSSGRIFVEFWFSSYALISFGESIGVMFCAYFNGGLAVSLVSAGITLLAQLNGVISASLMEWLKVIGWIAPMKPQAWLVAINEFVGLRFHCDQASIESGACIATNGEQVLDVFSIPHSGSGKYLGILIALIVIWRIFAWIALSLRTAYL